VNSHLLPAHSTHEKKRGSNGWDDQTAEELQSAAKRVLKCEAMEIKKCVNGLEAFTILSLGSFVCIFIFGARHQPIIL
jgi:hypothetical protein